MIDFRLILNLLTQSLVKEYNIPVDNNLPLDLKTLNEHSLYIFQHHDILMQVKDMQSKDFIKQQEFFRANITSYDMIFSLL